MSSTPTSMKDRRAAVRKQLAVKGLFRHPDGRTTPIKTFDASTMGVGVDHEEALALGLEGTVALALMDTNGVPVVIQAVAKIRHSHMGAGRWRSGLLFLGMSETHKEILERVLRPRLALLD